MDGQSHPKPPKGNFASRWLPDVVLVRANLFIEYAGEFLLLLLVGGFFIYLFFDSLSLAPGAWLMPRIIVIAGGPFVLIRIVIVIRNLWQGRDELTAKPPPQIMDTGFVGGDDIRATAARLTQVSLWVIATYAGIWLVGFHIALPAAVFSYLMIYGKAGVVWSTLIALLSLALILGLYDYLLNTPWNDPLLL